MPDGAAAQVAELLSTPLEQLLAALGRGIGEAQAALDRHSIEIQQLIDADPALGQLGVQATWYQIPSTQLELKLAIALEQQPDTTPVLATDTGIVDPLRPLLPRLWAQPVNARYVNQFAYDVNASSTVTLTVVPVPPPPALAATRPQSNADQVISEQRGHLVADEGGNLVGTVGATFNPASRTWFVVQTQPGPTGPVLVKLLVVEDGTLFLVREEPPAEPA